MRHTMIAVMTSAVLATAGFALGDAVNVYPGNIGDGAMTVTGNGWQSDSAWLNPTGYDFGANPYSLNLATYNGGAAVALRGLVSIADCGLARTGDWSKFYAIFRVTDNNGKRFQVVFGDDWLGSWQGIGAQPADRIRLENNGGYPQPEEYYFTQGGWTDHSPSTRVFPTDREYYMQMVFDPTNKTIDLSIYGKGNGGAQSPPNSNNSVDYKQWYNINNDPDFHTGPISVGDNFNFQATQMNGILYNSTQGPADMTNTLSWTYMSIGAPLASSQTPVGGPGLRGLVEGTSMTFTEDENGSSGLGVVGMETGGGYAVVLPDTVTLDQAEVDHALVVSGKNYLTLKMYYTDEELEQAGLSEETLRLYWYDTLGAHWYLGGTTTAGGPGDSIFAGIDVNESLYTRGYTGLNTVDNYVWANIDHASEYGEGGFVVPEPAALGLIGLGLIGLARRRRS